MCFERPYRMGQTGPSSGGQDKQVSEVLEALSGFTIRTPCYLSAKGLYEFERQDGCGQEDTKMDSERSEQFSCLYSSFIAAMLLLKGSKHDASAEDPGALICHNVRNLNRSRSLLNGILSSRW